MTGLTRTADHRYQWNDGPFVPGATSVIRVLDKPGLIQWAKNETAACAVRNFDFVADLIARGGPDAAARWLSAIPDYKRDTAAELGSAVHRMAEQIARGEEFEIAAEHLVYIDGYRRFLEDLTPTSVRVERMVYSEHGYGGTIDLLARIDGKTTLIDLKTGRSVAGINGQVYPEIRLQLAAYGMADFVGRPGDGRKYKMPSIQRYAVLHLSPSYERAYRLIEVDATIADFEAFLACLRIQRWRASLNGKG
jgi:hypothetical protein